MIIRKVEPKRCLGLRIAPTLIDYGVYFAVIFIYTMMFGTPNDEGGSTPDGAPTLMIAVFWFLYFVVLQAVNQATPGHDILKLVAVKTKGDRISFTHALKRRIIDIIDIAF